MKKVFCFGEALLRMSPDVNGGWLQHNTMPVFVGGAELNVATALARWNVPVSYCTVLPDHYLAHQIVDTIRSNGIDTSAVLYRGERIGLYYLQQGADLKQGSVIYDRTGSSFYTLVPGMIDWDAVLQDVAWFHCSAISPALNENVAMVCEEALKAASKKNIKTSIDLNYRARLWQYGIEPRDIMPGLVAHCDVVMGNIWAANTLLGIPVEEKLHEKKSKAAYLQHATVTADAIKAAYPKCKVVANTFRFDVDDAGINYYAAIDTDGQQYVSTEFSTDHIINKIGSGDCFMAGLIYGLHIGEAVQHVVNVAASAAFGKLQEPGDATNQTIDITQQRINQYG